MSLYSRDKTLTVATESATASVTQLTRHSGLHGDVSVVVSVTVSMTCIVDDMRAAKNAAPRVLCTSYAVAVRSPRSLTTLCARQPSTERCPG
jgi:hypothetical protein